MSLDILESSRRNEPARLWHRPVVLVLGWKEGWRMVTSPVMAVAAVLALFPLGVGSLTKAGRDDFTVTAIYAFLVYLFLLWVGLLAYVAAHLVTSSPRRSGAERVLAALPGTERQRGLAACAGAVVGPGLVTLLVTGLLAWLGSQFDVGPDGEQPFSGAELAQLPLIVIGGGIFGVVLATWLRFPGSLPLGFVTLVFSTLWLVDEARPEGVRWFVPFTTATDFYDASWTHGGSQGWHAVYLVCLGALGVCAVALRQRAGRGRWLVAAGTVLALTALVGWAQV